jgi:hypothetical protein
MRKERDGEPPRSIEQTKSYFASGVAVGSLQARATESDRVPPMLVREPLYIHGTIININEGYARVGSVG